MKPVEYSLVATVLKNERERVMKAGAAPMYAALSAKSEIDVIVSALSVAWAARDPEFNISVFRRACGLRD